MPILSFWSDLLKIFSKARQTRPRQVSIYRSLPLGMAFVVAIMIFIGGIFAISLTWRQLEDQVKLRVLNAQSSTRALYTSEQRDLLQLTRLVSERPTLCTLLQRRDSSELSSYLEELRQNTSVDSLVAVSADGERFISGSVNLPPDGILSTYQGSFVDFIALEHPTRLAIIAVSEVTSSESCKEGLAGRVMAIRVLDHDFMRMLAENTGLEQSLIVDDRRVATSLTHLPEWPLNSDVALQVFQTKEACCSTGTSGGETYYIGLAPLLDDRGNVVALSEVALSTNIIRGKTLITIALIFGISVLAGLAGGFLTLPLSRRITDPLYKLSDAAERMGAGDLETPIPISSGWITIDRLASQLDRSRRNLQQINQITRRGLRRIAHLLGATREGIITFDEDGIITWANSDACQILGYTIVKLLRKHSSRIFRPAPGETITLRNILQPRPGQSPPKRLTVLDARDHPITLTVSLSSFETEYEDTQRPHHEHVLILRDVSEEYAVNRLRSEFLANVAHEFRTPLSAISASTELLVEEGYDMNSDEVSDLAHAIRLSTVHLQALVNNLLESTIIEAGVFHLSYRYLQLKEVLRKVAEMMLPLLQRSQQRLVVEASGNFPSIWSDADRLSQALINLVENASKFSPSGAAITLTVTQESDMITFSVLDSGPGLPAERFDNLFSRFFTGDRRRGSQFGIGLGLPIVKAIAEAHGGRVGAENRPEGGARVWFTIRLRRPDDEGEG
jgi:PAS domain S-box-containing protein